MTDSSKETADVLNQVLQEWGPRVNLQYNSKVLVSDGNVAKTIYAATEVSSLAFDLLLRSAAHHEHRSRHNER